MEQMNPEAKAELERILTRNPEDLSQTERDFLNARRWALNNEQRRIFHSVLIQDPEQGVPEQPQAPQQPEALKPQDDPRVDFHEPHVEGPNEAPQTEATIPPVQPSPPHTEPAGVPVGDTQPVQQPEPAAQEPTTPTQPRDYTGENMDNPYDVNVSEKDPSA